MCDLVECARLLDEQVAAPDGAGFVTVPEIANFLISGFVAYFSWHRGMRQLFGPPR